MTNAIKTLVLALFTLCISQAVLAQSAPSGFPTENLVKIRLLPEHGEIKPGQTIWVGVEHSIAEHWHVYWKNPGDSGAETRIQWTLPEGFAISDIHWPTPHKIPYPPLMNYGYEGNVILLQKLTAPSTLPDGPLTLSADIELLVCKEECIPEFGVYEMALNDPMSEAEDNSAYLAEAAAKLPKPFESTATYNEIGSLLQISLDGLDESFSQVEFFPEQWGLVENTAAATAAYEDGKLVVEQERGERKLSEIEGMTGVVVLTKADGTRSGYKFTAQPETLSAQAVPSILDTDSITVWQALLLAFLGGLILNLMPCVFPVLSIKALSLVKTADKHPGAARLSGLAYTAGVLLSFLFIAGLLLVFKGAGAQIGWGFQLQNPVVIAALAYLLFVIGLSLSGLFEIGGGLMNTGSKLAGKEGMAGSFFTGILATIVATPCTAPFMGVAIGFALVQPAAINLAVFAALGLGLALPYLLLSFVPALRHVLPKPGPWMVTFKELLAFPMYASAVWLVWVLSQQASSGAVMAVLMGMVAITFGIWLWSKAPGKGFWRFKVRALALLAFAGAALALPAAMVPATLSTQDMTEGEETFGQRFTEARLNDLLAQSYDPVFVEMTAAWCITCKVNHATSINIDSTKQVFAENNVHFLIGDWTNQDAEITKYLNSYGRNGVPLYVFYGRRDVDTGLRPEPVVLPQILTPGIISRTVKSE